MRIHGKRAKNEKLGQSDETYKDIKSMSKSYRVIKYDKKDQQEKAAFNERNPFDKIEKKQNP
jgi:hypothetical protein